MLVMEGSTPYQDHHVTGGNTDLVSIKGPGTRTTPELQITDTTAFSQEDHVQTVCRLSYQGQGHT